MDTEEILKTEMRLSVLETLVALLYAGQHKMSGDPERSLEALRKSLTEKARAQVFVGLDPVVSDAASAELEAAVDAAIRLQRGWLGLND